MRGVTYQQKRFPYIDQSAFSPAQERRLPRRDVREKENLAWAPSERAREPERGTVPLPALVCALTNKTLLTTFHL